jgi:CheY-like chemotaxis protein
VAETSGKGAGILLVEDDIRTRNSSRRALSELGYRVLEAENAAGAMALLEQGAAVDLLFTDVSMPGELDGRALAHWARERLPGLKVLLTSGYLQPAADEEAPGRETLPFLQKPYSKEQLQQMLLSLLESQSS